MLLTRHVTALKAVRDDIIILQIFCQINLDIFGSTLDKIMFWIKSHKKISKSGQEKVLSTMQWLEMTECIAILCKLATRLGTTNLPYQLKIPFIE